MIAAVVVAVIAFNFDQSRRKRKSKRENQQKDEKKEALLMTSSTEKYETLGFDLGRVSKDFKHPKRPSDNVQRTSIAVV